jgi:S1-C subfamily serine protease
MKKLGGPALAGVFLLFIACSIALGEAQQREETELNTLLMEATFQISGPGSLGTAFVIGRPTKKDPSRSWNVLVTAHHVLSDIKGPDAILQLRRQSASGTWEVLGHSVKIRDGQRALWTKHPEADVACMFVPLPKDLLRSLLPTTLLVDDKTLKEFEIHPGDELNCLGYPLGPSGPFGFPILRSGKIASYPLLPTKQTKTFLMDFRISPGNSGGPVYLVQSNRTFGGSSRLGMTIRMVMGLVSDEIRWKREIQELYGKREEVHPLGIAEVIHASLILEAVMALLEPSVEP